MTAPQPLVETFTIGRWRVHAIQAGGQRLDGGAMFGVVPKPLWERRIPADDRNRIPMGMRCLLVEHESGLVLIDTGSGNKENAKFIGIYGIENEAVTVPGRTALEDGLAQLGVRADDISIVIDTHLHFDHAGGNTFVDPDRGNDAPTPRITFERARYVVQRGEYDFATHANERTAASYFPANYAPLVEAGVLELLSGEQEIVEGIRVIPTPGHTPHHQSVLLTSNGDTAFYAADLVPTAAHLPLPWIMGYDVEPLVTLETKRAILKRAANEGWLMLFEHDATVSKGYVRHDGKSYALATNE
jgi:glyoxylase-like metal-dependent hydrolase (beta-lactamase superfamily II)